MSEWWKALRAGDADTLHALIASGADVDACDQYGQTALMNAARDGHIAIVRLLIAHDADLDHTAKFTLSAIMLAVLNGRDAIVGVLADAGADLSIRGTGAPGFAGKTALEIAEAADRVLMIALLRDAGA